METASSTYAVPQQAPYQTVQYAQPACASSTVASPVTGISTTVAATPSSARTVVLGPGLVGLSIARVGQFMAQAGKTHVWTINHTTVRPVQTPVAPVTTMMAVVQQQPVYQQQQVQLVSMPVQQPVQQVYRIDAPSENAPPPPVIGPPVVPPVVVQPPAQPTPQAQPVAQPTHKLFGMFHH